jgi:hypothetical protein
LCCYSTSVYCCKRIFRYRFSPETFEYTLVNGLLVTRPVQKQLQEEAKDFIYIFEYLHNDELTAGFFFFRNNYYTSSLRSTLNFRGTAVHLCPVRFPAGAGNFSLHHRVQNGSGAHSASYPMGTRGSFPGDKAVGT